MSKRSIAFVAVVLAVMAMVAVSGRTVLANGPSGAVMAQSMPDWDELQARIQARLERLHEKLARLQEQRTKDMDETLARLHEQLALEQDALSDQLAQEHERLAERMAEQHLRWADRMGDFELEGLPQEPIVVVETDGSGYLGVSIEEVSAEKAKELKLGVERGAYIREVSDDSPAAKAGLKVGDVVTEFNGQRVEGTVQFRRMVRETPAGRTVQLTVWRDGRSQNISAQLGSARDHMMRGMRISPPDIHIEMPRFEAFAMVGRTPLLGIQADDIRGQLGTYFGVPEGEGILVREVGEDSPAAKAGLKAGDVIIKVDGDRVKTTSDLRAKLREKRESKTVAVGVIRKGAETSVNVEIEQPKPRERSRVISRRTAL
jgi:C-terminal processing protease CtpA/Prc